MQGTEVEFFVITGMVKGVKGRMSDRVLHVKPIAKGMIVVNY